MRLLCAEQKKRTLKHATTKKETVANNKRNKYMTKLKEKPKKKTCASNVVIEKSGYDTEFKVLEKSMLAPNVHFIKIYAPFIAQKAQPGQFVIIMPDTEGERIPLSLSDWDTKEGSISIVIMDVGTTTRKIAALKKGDIIDGCAGPLGKPAEIAKYGTVVCAGGCYGIGAMFPVARAMKKAGNKVIAIVEARGEYLLFWEDKYKGVADVVLSATTDGSKGTKGHVTDTITELVEGGEKIDRVCAIGCTFMMKITTEATKPHNIPTKVQLNPIMIDGTGMCGVCRVLIGGKQKFACVDGPEFDAHEVDWENLSKRKTPYLEEEKQALQIWECKTYG
ncbi:sulfide/dihydroorotate dehydrogenase-like FAD/NAD-binding protein [Elusimicrobiota bacterium]